MLEVLTISAEDSDGGSNGEVKYHFRVGDKNVQETNEFHLDSISGLLTTKMVLDREVKSKYEVINVSFTLGLKFYYISIHMVHCFEIHVSITF